MFTGIIEATGRLQSLEPRQGDLRLWVSSEELDFADVRLGDSIATNGVCLTVVELSGRTYAADVSRETLSHTTLASWQPGRLLNLEKALLPTTRLGGHLVSGHVDGVGTIKSRRTEGRSLQFEVEAPANLSRYIAHKGSITVDGVSLTVNAVAGQVFSLNIVPHSASHTNLLALQPGAKVNLEVDLLARYLERLIQPAAGEQSGLTLAKLAEHGFWRA
ncbi:riboflavin synthase [Balneatrix alpica]|uniref:Riboflavin synthase n=1 Tax=Balneatrix alpica TaxID=75684 RepID=A0ABV5ZFP8_9GAMM|nr:riboflavin synthase [Balneatrix alpica]